MWYQFVLALLLILSSGAAFGQEAKTGGAPRSKYQGSLPEAEISFAGVHPQASSGISAKGIKLPPPRLERGKSLMQALKDRQSGRAFSSEQLPLEVLSDLLWAGNGVNRIESGKRTAPSAMNAQEIDIYVAMIDGLYLYDAKNNALIMILHQDIRAMTGTQPFVKEAPINLIFVADYSRMRMMSDQNKEFYACTDTGFVSENIYLYCAQEGLATVVRGWFDGAALAKAMKLRVEQRIILTQSVGYPAK